MQAAELPLTNQENLQSTQLLVGELATNLQVKENLRFKSNYNPQISLENTLNTIFPEPKEENKLIKARRILGEVAQGQSDEQLQVFLTELQYLINSWFDEYEKQLFDGLTLEQLLRGG